MGGWVGAIGVFMGMWGYAWGHGGIYGVKGVFVGLWGHAGGHWGMHGVMEVFMGSREHLWGHGGGCVGSWRVYAGSWGHEVVGLRGYGVTGTWSPAAGWGGGTQGWG